MKQTTASKRSFEKWGEAANGGFQTLPDILLKKQVELGLSPTDMLVLLNLTMHWWYAHIRPFPRTSVIAQRMGVEMRTVQRSLRKMMDLKLIARAKEKDENGDERLVYDLTGLIERLERFIVSDIDYRIRIEKKLPPLSEKDDAKVPF